MPTRREFVAGLAGLLALPSFPFLSAFPAGPALPTPAQLAWLDLELGMFVHFAPNTWQDLENDDRSIAPADLPFTADPTQWADTAVALGARYVVMVAKHVGGFCLWQTASSEYSVRNTRWKDGRGDVMAELAEACRARGLKLGVYLSPRDDHFGAGLGGRCATPELQAVYNRAARQQLTELLTRYGAMAEVWFDGSSVVPVGDILAEHARGAMVFQGPHATIRWVGNEDGFAPDPAWNALALSDARTGIATARHGDPAGDAWMPLETDVSIRRPDWFWSSKNVHKLLTLDQLLDIYYRSVGRGTALLLNLMPDRSGRIPEEDAARAAAFGAEVRRRFGAPVAEARGLMVRLSDPGMADHVVLEEGLRGGQRILSYRIEGARGGRWEALGEGTSVGHKRIHPIPTGRYAGIRAVFPASLGRPSLRRLAVFHTESAPPPDWRRPAGVWADNEAGQWKDGRLDLDLTAKIDAAAQYRLRFVGSGESRTAPRLRGVELTIGGIAQPALLRKEPGREDALILTVTGLGQSVRIRATIEDVPSGLVLIRRL